MSECHSSAIKDFLVLTSLKQNSGGATEFNSRVNHSCDRAGDFGCCFLDITHRRLVDALLLSFSLKIPGRYIFVKISVTFCVNVLTNT